MSALDALDERQREAASVLRGPVAVLAGAGTGKTELMVYRGASIIRTGAADIDQLNDIIDTFLGYARHEHTEIQPTLLAPVISKCITPFRSHSQMDIEVDVPEDTVVMADAIELGRALSNLLENARRYGQSARDGVSHVRIQAGSNAGVVLLRVLDQGGGVPEDQLQNLTRPFFRGERARTSATGSGLGLAIVERAITRMGGRLKLFNRAEGGLMAEIELKGER